MTVDDDFQQSGFFEEDGNPGTVVEAFERGSIGLTLATSSLKVTDMPPPAEGDRAWRVWPRFTVDPGPGSREDRPRDP